MIEAEESELIDDYALGELSSSESEQLSDWIEASFALRTRVLIAQGLHGATFRKARGPVPWYGWVAGIAACFILVTILFSMRHKGHETSAVILRASSPPILKQDTILIAVQRLRGNTDAQTINAYTVHSGSSVRLQVLLPPSAHSDEYTIVLYSSSPEKTEVWRSIVTPVQNSVAPYVQATLPPGTLHPDKYSVKLSGSHGSYDQVFSVTDR